MDSHTTAETGADRIRVLRFRASCYYYNRAWQKPPVRSWWSMWYSRSSALRFPSRVPSLFLADRCLYIGMHEPWWPVRSLALVRSMYNLPLNGPFAAGLGWHHGTEGLLLVRLISTPRVAWRGFTVDLMTFDDDSDDNGKDSRGRGKVLLFPASSILQCIFKWVIRSKNGRIEEGNETSTGLTTETKPRNMTLKWGWLTGQLTRGRVVTHVPPRRREGESGFLSFFFFGARFPFPSWCVDGWNDIMTFVPSTVYPACSGQDGKFSIFLNSQGQPYESLKGVQFSSHITPEVRGYVCTLYTYILHYTDVHLHSCTCRSTGLNLLIRYTGTTKDSIQYCVRYRIIPTVLLQRYQFRIDIGMASVMTRPVILHQRPIS